MCCPSCRQTITTGARCCSGCGAGIIAGRLQPPVVSAPVGGVANRIAGASCLVQWPSFLFIGWWLGQTAILATWFLDATRSVVLS